MFFIWILWVGALAQVPHLTTSFKIEYPPGNYKSDNLLTEVFNLKYANYTFENSADQEAYNPKDMVAIDCFTQKLIESAEEIPSLLTHRFFITFWGGNSTPASLCTVSNQTGEGGNLVTPYPDWSWAKCTDCDHCFVNVFRVAIDYTRNILIVLDSGATRNGRSCQPKLVFMDLKTDKLLKVVRIPPPTDETSGASLLVNVVILSQGPGDLNYSLAIADVSGYHMILYKDFEFKWISSPSFRNNPSASVITSDGLSMTLQDGILGMAKGRGDTLYYRAFTSYDVCVTSFSALNEAYSSDKLKFKSYKNVLSSQAPTIAVSSEGALLYVLTNESALACMDTRNMKGGETILEQNTETLRFASSTRVVGNVLSVFTDNFVSYYDGQTDLSKINYRLLCGKTSDILKGTKCISTSEGGGQSGGKDHVSSEGDGSDGSGIDESNSDNSGSSSGNDDCSSNKGSDESAHKSHESGDGSNSKGSDESGHKSNESGDGGKSKGSKNGSNESHDSGDGGSSENNVGSKLKSHESGEGGNSKGSDESGHKSNESGDGGKSKGSKNGSNESH